MDNYEARVEAIGHLADSLPGAEITPKNIKAYVWGLGDLSVEVLKMAIDRTIDTHKYAGLFPTVAEIRENAGAVSTEGNEGKHPASCKCWGIGLIQYIENGYNQVKRCDGVAIEADPVDDY